MSAEACAIAALAVTTATLAGLLAIAIAGNHNLAEENSILVEENADLRFELGAVKHPGARALRLVRGGR